MSSVPMIRDVLTVDQTTQDFYNSFAGDGPVFLLGRVVQHAPNYTLQLNGRPLIIIADTYIGNGGGIDGSGGIFTGNGSPKAHPAPVAGGRGTDGANARLRKIGTDWRPVSAGGKGTPGGHGSSGLPGTTVTLFCHSATDLRINVAATVSAPGGDGGNGGIGGNGLPDRTDANGEVIEGYPGTRGGQGGNGGAGGNGANGGTLVIVTTQPIASPALTYGSTAGSPGGRGGRWPQDGLNTPVNDDGTDDSHPDFAANGHNGTDGTSPQPEISVTDNASYLDRLRSLLDSDQTWNFANFWAPFRVSAGEYYFRKFQPDDRSSDMGVLAAREFKAALELQPDNVEALRLQSLLLSGSNAIGLPRYLDVVPDFNRYINTYDSVATLVTSFFNAGVAQILAAQQLDALKALLTAQRMIAQDAVANATSDLAFAQSEQKSASDEVAYIQQQLDDTTAQINQAAEAMKSQGITIEGVFGTVAEIGAAVASIAAAIPSGGTSLVALVPSILVLTSTVVEEGPRIANQVFAGGKPDLDDVRAAYKKVGEEVQAVVAAGKTVANFVKVVEKITSGSTPENAASVALVKRGAELTHQLLVAKNHIDLNAQRIAAIQSRKGKAQGLLEYITNAADITADDIRTAGQQTIYAALLQVDALLTFAFLAQRSFEIYTVPTGPQLTPLMNAGVADPNILRAYQDGLPNMEGAMLQSFQASWNTLLRPVSLQKAYADYLQRSVQSDIVRLEFNTDKDGPLLDQLRTTGFMPFQLGVESISQDRRETKIRGVAVSLVGAVSPSKIVSCDVWHGTRYEQIGPDGSLNVQLLEAKSYTLQAPVTPLAIDPVHFGQDSPIDAPQALPFWGRGAGGEWNLRLPATQPHGEPVDLSNLQTVQVWIGYQFVPVD